MPAKITLLLFFLFLTGLSPKLVAQSPWTYVGDVDADLTHVGYGRCGELLGESPSAIYTSVDGGLTWTLLTARPLGQSAVLLLQLPTQSIVLIKDYSSLVAVVPGCGGVDRSTTALHTYRGFENRLTADVDATLTFGRSVIVVREIPAADRSPARAGFAILGAGEPTTLPFGFLNRYARLERGSGPRADSLYLQQPLLLSFDGLQTPRTRRSVAFGKPAGADTLFYSNLVSLDAADTLVTVWTRAGQPEGLLVARRGLPDGSWTTQEIDRGHLREVRADGSTALAILTSDGVYFAPDARVSAFAKTLPARRDISFGQLNADATEAIRVLADGRLERQRPAGVDTIARPRIGNGAGVLQTTAAGTLLVGGDGRWYEFDPRQPSAVPSVVDLGPGVTTRVDTIGGRTYRQVWTAHGTVLVTGADTIYRSPLHETFEFVGGGADSRILLRADGNLLVGNGRTDPLPDLLRGPLQVIGADTLVVYGVEIQLLSAAGRRTVPFEARPPSAALVPRVYREGASFRVAYTARNYGPSAVQLYSLKINPMNPTEVTTESGNYVGLASVLFQAGDYLYIGRGAPRPLFGVQPTAAAGFALTVPTAAFVAEAGICYYSGGGRGHAPFSATCDGYTSGVRGIVRLGDRVYISGDGGIFSQSVVCSPLDTIRLDTAIAVGEVLAGVRVTRVGQTVTAERPIAGSACTQPVVYRVTQVVSVGIPASLQTARIFPNPVSSTLRIDGLPADGVATTITIRDLLGRTIAPPQTTLGMDATTVDVATLPSGVYLVQVTRPEGSRVWKVQRY